MINVQAVYENGVLRPEEPLKLTEGERVSISVSPIPKVETLEQWGQWLRAAKSVEEWAELANACPDPGPDIDIMKAINESRRLTGFRMPDPEPSSETAQ